MYKKITKEEIESKMSAKGGYTKAQLAEWGVKWSPHKGWKADLIKYGINLDKVEKLKTIKLIN